MDKFYKVVGAEMKFSKLVCVFCEKNPLVSFLYLLDNICAIELPRFWSVYVTANAGGCARWSIFVQVFDAPLCHN